MSKVKPAPKVCGNCAWYDRVAVKCAWDCNCPKPSWFAAERIERNRLGLFDARNCAAWKPTETNTKPTEEPCKT